MQPTQAVGFCNLKALTMSVNAKTFLQISSTCHGCHDRIDFIHNSANVIYCHRCSPVSTGDVSWHSTLFLYISIISIIMLYISIHMLCVLCCIFYALDVMQSNDGMTKQYSANIFSQVISLWFSYDIASRWASTAQVRQYAISTCKHTCTMS